MYLLCLDDSGEVNDASQKHVVLGGISFFNWRTQLHMLYLEDMRLGTPST